MSSTPKADWEAIERILSETFGGPETGVVNEIIFHYEMGVLEESYGWPPIIRFEQEFTVPRGRVDIMLFHADGSGTVIECKATRDPRELLPAVGQVLSYAVQVGYGRSLRSIRKVIASRASAADLVPIRDVYRQCGIEPMFCGQFSPWAKGFVDLISAQ